MHFLQSSSKTRSYTEKQLSTPRLFSALNSHRNRRRKVHSRKGEATKAWATMSIDYLSIVCAHGAIRLVENRGFLSSPPFYDPNLIFSTVYLRYSVTENKQPPLHQRCFRSDILICVHQWDKYTLSRISRTAGTEEPRQSFMLKQIFFEKILKLVIIRIV